MNSSAPFPHCLFYFHWEEETVLWYVKGGGNQTKPEVLIKLLWNSITLFSCTLTILKQIHLNRLSNQNALDLFIIIFLIQWTNSFLHILKMQNKPICAQKSKTRQYKTNPHSTHVYAHTKSIYIMKVSLVPLWGYR